MIDYSIVPLLEKLNTPKHTVDISEIIISAVHSWPGMVLRYNAEVLNLRHFHILLLYTSTPLHFGRYCTYTALHVFHISNFAEFLPHQSHSSNVYTNLLNWNLKIKNSDFGRCPILTYCTFNAQVLLIWVTFTFTKVKSELNMFTFTQVGLLSTLHNTVSGHAAFAKDYGLTPSVVFWNCYRVTSVFLIFSTTLQ